MSLSTAPASTAAGLRTRSVTTRAATNRISERLGAWELVELVAEGAFSHVFRARTADGDVARAAAYAVKRLKPELEADPTAIQLLRREARVGSTIHHPRLAPILAANVERPPYYLVMPWLAGSTMEAIFERAASDTPAEHVLARARIGSAAPARPPVSLIHALWFARQIAEALSALDAAGWTHCDVKPANIMISPQGHATLLDLGLARRPADEDHSIDRALTGTPAYMAPELFVSTVRPDIRSDIFSLGTILHELLTGRRSNRWKDSTSAVTSPRRPVALDPRELARAAPPTVAQLVQQMLAGEPLRRPQRPAQLIEALTALEVEFFAEGID